MISFYPGPSQLDAQVGKWMQEAVDQGILSINHRSDSFMEMMAQTKSALTRHLDIPSGFEIIFTSSATECWEMISQSALKGISLHIFNGAFGEKWYNYAHNIKKGSEEYPFGLQEVLPVDELLVPIMAEIVCITQNETSNGTQVKNDVIKYLMKSSPTTLVAVDATSSLGGIALDLSQADIWFASVQKCFGLPAGLGVMIFSDRAVERIKEIGEKDHYNSISTTLAFGKLNQTAFTPNVLSIYLLGKVAETRVPISKSGNSTAKRAEILYDFFENNTPFTPLIRNQEVRSDTVVALKGSADQIALAHHFSEKAGLLLGKGYGKWQKETFRIANFPSHTDSDFDQLIDLMKSSF